MLREQTMPGEVQMSFEREPDTALAASIEGDVHQTLVARDRATGRLVGSAGRSVRDAYLNGAPARLGYLGQLRIERGCRRVREVLAEGFEFCRTLHDQDDARVYLASLVADHGVARRLLIRPAFGAAPAFVPVDELTTFALHVRRRQGRRDGGRVFRPGVFDLEPGSDAHVPAIAACLQRNLSRFQFSPMWTAEDLRSPLRTRGLAAEDFVVALAHGRVVGCAALWDQRAFKQVRIRGYAPRLARVRPLVNLASRVVGRPSLPAVGDVLPSAYLSHVAIDDDRADVFLALLSAQRRQAAERGLDFLVTGFATRHPFHSVVASEPHHSYRSTLYAGYWPDGEVACRTLDGRISQPEVAVL
jgi:hypothetical protein